MFLWNTNNMHKEAIPEKVSRQCADIRGRFSEQL